jgi:hydroxymethylpyrimidine pyrophosphatase-like HAD family hydrolase
VTLAPAGGDLRAILERTGIDVEYGSVIASADVRHVPRLRAALLEAGHLADLVQNRDRVMVLPPGITKAVGLLSALTALGIAPEETAAAGDGENDLPMLSAVGYAVAVQNAVGEVKAIAHDITSRPGGEGIADWITERWLASAGACP